MKKMMRLLAAAKVAVLFFALAPLALAQESQPTTTATLSECVAFFTQGGPFEWIIGGVFLLATVLGMFFRHSVISLLKDIAAKLLDGKRK